MLSMMDIVCFVKKWVCFSRTNGGVFLAFLSHRRWFLLNIVLYWRQKFRLAVSWENDGIGSAGNIFKQVAFLLAWDSIFSVFIVFFIFLLLFDHIWSGFNGHRDVLLRCSVIVAIHNPVVNAMCNIREVYSVTREMNI